MFAQGRLTGGTGSLIMSNQSELTCEIERVERIALIVQDQRSSSALRRYAQDLQTSLAAAQRASAAAGQMSICNDCVNREWPAVIPRMG